MPLLGRHRFLPTSGAKHCHICHKAEAHAIHNCDEPIDHGEGPLQNGDFTYWDVGSVKLVIYDGCSTDALGKVYDFIGNIVAQRS